MSSAYAFAAVSAVLRQTIIEGLALAKVADATGTVTVSALPPDRVVRPNQPEPTQVNLYLHQVTPNAAWRNFDQPMRNSRGEVVSAPPMAVSLHYLISTFAADPFVAEALLGHVMRIMHENPMLAREAIRRALAVGAASPLVTAMRGAGLADQIELVKLTPTAIALEEMSRVWSAFQSHYRTTVAYEASVILVDPRTPARAALPAAGRAVFGETLDQPQIFSAGIVDQPNAPVDTDALLTITGERLLSAAGTIIRIGSTDRSPEAGARADRLEVDLAAAPRPRAGIVGVSIVHPRAMGVPAVAHAGVSSNVAALVLRPVLTAVSRANSATRTLDGIPYADGIIAVTVSRAIGRDQRVELLLNERGAPSPRPPRGYVIAAPAANGLADGTDEAVQIAIPYRAVARGSYLARIRVDGAESLLGVDGSGVYATPAVTI